MPLYEFLCENCNYLFEKLLKPTEDFPCCPRCGSSQIKKLFSSFSFRDLSNWKKEREKAILKRTKDYLLDGKTKEAQRFLKKAQTYIKSDTINKISDKIFSSS